MLEDVEAKPVAYDEECPPLTEDQLERFHRVAENNRANRRKQTVTLRLSPQALNRAKSLGKGYTSVLSRILEDVLRDSSMVEKYL